MHIKCLVEEILCKMLNGLFSPQKVWMRLMLGSFHLSYFVSFGDKLTKVSCHFQAKTVQLFFFVFRQNNEKRKSKDEMNPAKNASRTWISTCTSDI